jgi:hypothetical protein
MNAVLSLFVREAVNEEALLVEVTVETVIFVLLVANEAFVGDVTRETNEAGLGLSCVPFVCFREFLDLFEGRLNNV